MRNKITKEQIESMKKFLEKGLTSREISEKLNLKQNTVKNYLVALKNGFESSSEYQNELIIRKGFKTRIEYIKHLLRKKGFLSLYQYKTGLIIKRGFKTQREYKEYIARKNNFDSERKYILNLVKKKGFKTISDYQKHILEKNKQKKKNKTLGTLIKTRLKEMNQSQKWLSERTGIDKSLISRYSNGYYFPEEDYEKRILKTLKINYNSLEEMLENQKNLPDYIRTILKN